MLKKNKTNFMIKKFNKNNFNFYDLFFSEFRDKSDIQNFLNKNKAFLIEYFYKKIKTEEFKSLYKKFVKILRKELRYDFFYQYQPSIRIQKPNDKEQPFHVDSWVGHGKNIQNIWLPLMDTNKFNSLQIIKSKDSNIIKKKFNKEKLSVSKLFKICIKKAKPAIIKYGEYLIFNENNLHGQIQNKSKFTRVSIDFRILPAKFKSDTGIKEFSSFFLSMKKNKKKNKIKEAVSIVYSVNTVKNIPHNIQRIVIEDYAKKNNLTIIRENSEWYNVEHYPQLNEHLATKKYPIVIFSDKCLSSFDEIDKDFQKKLKNYKKGIHFALENYKL